MSFGFIALAIWFLSSGDSVKQEIAMVKNGKLIVVTSFFPLYDFTKNIAKDRIELDILFSQTPEVSSFSPIDIQKINRADILIKNGAGLEPVLNDLIQSSDNKSIIVIDTSHNISLGRQDKSRNQDPHIWLNPRNAIIQVENIRDALIANDSDNADFYKRNADEYIQLLYELDQEIEDEVNLFRQKDFIAFHSAFQYFAERYGLSQVASIEEFPGKEPSPRYIAEVIKTIRDLGITAIFSEPQFSPKIIEVIAKDLGLEARVLNPIETGNLESDSYISLMRSNLETLKEVMK